MLNSIYSVRILSLLFIVTLIGLAGCTHAEKNISEKSPSTVNTSSTGQTKNITNPIAYSPESIKKGKLLFWQQCASCHNRDGRAKTAIVANAADLTKPETWRYGVSDAEVFNSISEGAGNSMPPFKYTISNDEDIWHMVNFIRSL